MLKKRYKPPNFPSHNFLIKLLDPLIFGYETIILYGTEDGKEMRWFLNYSSKEAFFTTNP